MKTVANISGGKDSVAMCLRLLEEGEHVDEFVFADTGVEYPECYAAIERFELLTGRQVTKVKVMQSFEYFLIDKVTKHRTDKPRRDGTPRRTCGYGWPSYMKRWCTRLKTNALDKYAKTLGDFVHCVGIAVDEPKRIRDNPLKRYPLVEWGMTESDCLAYCRERGFYKSPCAYDDCGRMSCFLCPLQNLSQIEYLVCKRPELWNEIKRLEMRLGEPWKRGTDYYESRFLDKTDELICAKSSK